MGGSQPTLIGSVQRALRLVDAVAMCDGPVPAKRLATLTGQALPTTYHLLRTLVYEGYLERLDEGYVLGHRLTGLTRLTRGQHLASRVRPTLRMLHDTLGVPSYLSAYEDGEINILDVVDSPSAQRVDLWVGFHDAGHATAIGKCILGSLSEAERKEYLSRHRMCDLTPHTITDSRVLLDQVRQQQDYAVDWQEYAVGTVCVAAPVRLADTVGAVALSMPPHRMQTILEQRDVLFRAAKRIESAYATSDSP